MFAPILCSYVCFDVIFCIKLTFLSNSSLSLVRLGVGLVLPLSQQQEQEPPPKISAVTDRILMKLKW